MPTLRGRGAPRRCIQHRLRSAQPGRRGGGSAPGAQLPGDGARQPRGAGGARRAGRAGLHARARACRGDPVRGAGSLPCRQGGECPAARGRRGRAAARPGPRGRVGPGRRRGGGGRGRPARGGPRAGLEVFRRSALRALRYRLPRPQSGAVQLQLGTRRLRDLSRLRAHPGRRLGPGDSRRVQDPARRRGQALADGQFQGCAARPGTARRGRRSAPGRALGRAGAAGTRLGDRRRSQVQRQMGDPVLRRAPVLRVARDPHLQDARAGAAVQISQLQPVPSLRWSPPQARRPAVAGGQRAGGAGQRCAAPAPEGRGVERGADAGPGGAEPA